MMCKVYQEKENQYTTIQRKTVSDLCHEGQLLPVHTMTTAKAVRKAVCFPHGPAWVNNECMHYMHRNSHALQVCMHMPSPF